MKKQRFIFAAALLLTAAMILGSCAHRDCQGKKHRVKTNMGGYL